MSSRGATHESIPPGGSTPAWDRRSTSLESVEGGVIEGVKSESKKGPFSSRSRRLRGLVAFRRLDTKPSPSLSEGPDGGSLGGPSILSEAELDLRLRVRTFLRLSLAAGQRRPLRPVRGRLWEGTPVSRLLGKGPLGPGRFTEGRVEDWDRADCFAVVFLVRLSAQ